MIRNAMTGFFAFCVFCAPLISIPAILSPAVAVADSKADNKECSAKADQKGLGAEARNRYIGECLMTLDGGRNSVKIKGSKGEISDDDKKQLVYCGNVAASRHLSGESFNRHMRDCLSK